MTVKRNSRNSGVALVMSVVMMTLLMAVIVVLLNTSQKDIAKTNNQQSLFRARLAAESGLSYLRRHVEDCELTTATTVDLTLSGLYSYLLTNIGGVTRPSSSIIVASRTLPTGTFTATIAAGSTVGSTCDIRMTVVGKYGSTTRTLTLDYNRAPGSRSPIFNYGFSSQGALRMTGISTITGKNDPSEANIFMATASTAEIIKLMGTSCIGGNVFAVNSSAYVTDAGTNCSVGGATGSAIADHVYKGVQNIPLPTVDISPFVTGVSFTDVTSSTTTSSVTLSNIRVKAGTNPTFSGCTLNGVIYIESPNKVKFTGTSNITGVIVTQTGTSDSSSEIDFSGGGYINSSANLPDLPEYRTVRSLPGTSLLAKGFSVKFTGNMTAVNGTMAADTFSFSGSGSMDVKGSIICYKDGEMVTVTGTQTILIDKSGDTTSAPPGFTGGTLTVLAPQSATLSGSGS